MRSGWQYFVDPQGRQIAIVTTEGRGGTVVHHTEVIDAGEVVDCFTLYGDHALDNTAALRGWEKTKEVATS